MCEKTCKFDAIHVVNGVAVIDYDAVWAAEHKDEFVAQFDHGTVDVIAGQDHNIRFQGVGFVHHGPQPFPFLNRADMQI